MYVDHVVWHVAATFTPFKMLKSQIILQGAGPTRQILLHVEVLHVFILCIYTKTKSTGAKA